MVTNQVVVAEELQDEGNLKPQVPEEEESENDKKKPIKTAVSGEVIVHHPPMVGSIYYYPFVFLRYVVRN